MVVDPGEGLYKQSNEDDVKSILLFFIILFFALFLK